LKCGSSDIGLSLVEVAIYKKCSSLEEATLPDGSKHD
jgi:hypothetical protein